MDSSPLQHRRLNVFFDYSGKSPIHHTGAAWGSVIYFVEGFEEGQKPHRLGGALRKPYSEKAALIATLRALEIFLPTLGSPPPTVMLYTDCRSLSQDQSTLELVHPFGLKYVPRKARKQRQAHNTANLVRKTPDALKPVPVSSQLVVRMRPSCSPPNTFDITFSAYDAQEALVYRFHPKRPRTAPLPPRELRLLFGRLLSRLNSGQRQKVRKSVWQQLQHGAYNAGPREFTINLPSLSTPAKASVGQGARVPGGPEK